MKPIAIFAALLLTGCGNRIQVGETTVKLGYGTFGMVPTSASRGNAAAGQSGLFPIGVNDAHRHEFAESSEPFKMIVESDRVVISGPMEQWTALDTIGDAANRGIRNGGIAWGWGKLTGLFKARDASGAATEQLGISTQGQVDQATIQAGTQAARIEADTTLGLAELAAP